MYLALLIFFIISLYSKLDKVVGGHAMDGWTKRAWGLLPSDGRDTVDAGGDKRLDIGGYGGPEVLLT